MASASKGTGQATSGKVTRSATGGSVVDQNKAIVRQFFDEGVNQRSLTTFDTLLAPTFVMHHPTQVQGVHGAAGFRHVLAQFLTAFPDMHCSIERLFGENDLICAQLRITGTNQGPWMTQAPTFKPVSYMSTNVITLQNGLITAMSVNDDLCGMLRQLGLITLPS